MGKVHSKDTFIRPTYSSKLHSLLCQDNEYRLMTSSARRLFRQAVMRELTPTKSTPRIAFVRPVLEFMPRPLTIKHKLFMKTVTTEVVPVPSKDKPYIETVFTKARPTLPKPNKRRRKNARILRAERENIDVVPTHQMIRRVQISSLAARFDFVNNLALTVVSIIDVLKSFCYWVYYALNSDDFGTLSRVSSYFGRVRVGDGEIFSQYLHELESDNATLFASFIYVVLRRRGIRPSFAQLNGAYRTFCEYEGIGLGTFGRTFYEYEPLIDMVWVREKVYWENLLYKNVARELTVLRGIRLFRNVTNTVMSIPVLGLAVSASALPASSAQVLNALFTLSRSPGSEVIPLNIDENGEYRIGYNFNLHRLRHATFDDFVETSREVGNALRGLDIRQGVNHLFDAARAARLRRRPDQRPQPDSRFEEL